MDSARSPRVLCPYQTFSLPAFKGIVPRNKLLIREYNESDLDALRRMHARQGFDYAFPDLADPIFVSKLVVEDDAGRAVMASLARLTCEMYMLADPADGDASRTLRAPARAAWCGRTRPACARPR